MESVQKAVKFLKPKMNIIDKKVRFRYPINQHFRLSANIDVRLPCPVVARRAKSEAEAKTHFALFDLSVLI